MAFLDILAQSLVQQPVVTNLTEGDNFLVKIANFLGLNKILNPDEATSTLVDFIMNANSAQINAVRDSLGKISQVNTVSESEVLDEGMKEFFDKFSPKLKTVIFAALMVAPKVMGDPEFIHDLKIAKDKAVINYGTDQIKNTVKSAPQAYLDLLKDMKDKYADEAGATEEETKEKLVRFIKGKAQDLQKNKEEVMDSAEKTINTKIDQSNKFKNFMHNKFNKGK